jgi:hypothetical protein
MKKEIPALQGSAIRILVLTMLREHVDNCFDKDGAYAPPADIVRATWRLLAKEVPTPPSTYNFFFSDAINGNDDFESAVVALAETGSIVDAQAVMSRALDHFEEQARLYLADFEVELRAYWAQPTDRE